MKTIKRIYSKNNKEIVLIEKSADSFNKTVLIIGVVHGDEPQGKFLIENYLKSCNISPKNRLLFIACLNPDGLELKTRENANGIDLNRNFPTKNQEKSSYNPEIEAKFVINIIKEFSPDIILTLHAPYKVVNYDGPAETIANEISKIINYPTSNDIGYPTPGSLGTYVGIERNIPIITLELDEEIDVQELTPSVSKIFDYLSNV